MSVAAQKLALTTLEQCSRWRWAIFRILLGLVKEQICRKVGRFKVAAHTVNELEDSRVCLAEGRNLGCSWASVKTAVVEHIKQRQATFRDQCVVASSRENRTPPMGAPNAACPDKDCIVRQSLTYHTKDTADRPTAAT